MARCLQSGGENLFQRIKRIRNDYEKRTGKEAINLSVGEPDGVPTSATRAAAAVACMSAERRVHVYQDNGAPEGFARAMVTHHVGSEIANRPDLAFLPIPGIKPMIGLLPLACGANAGREVVVAGTTKPGYPVIRTWSGYLGCRYSDWPLYAKNGFRPELADAPKGASIVVFNYPNNPTGATMSVSKWRELCDWATKNSVRLVNDAAYAALVHGEHAHLSQVAIEFPDLEWIELFSASKSHNATGWRIGVAFGSVDFIADLTTIKGNTDSGFAAPLAIGAMRAIDADQIGLQDIRKLYGRRVKILVELLSPYLKLAAEPNAGFFTFWHIPKEAFGKPVATADEFNNQIIEHCGIVGVPYTGSDGEYIRYAVCYPVEREEVQAVIRSSMVSANLK
jgi:LL-diaminopimelate aminotransferase